MTDWRDAFEKLVADGRLTRSERKALRALIDSEIDAESERVRVRAVAFDVAQAALSGTNAPDVIAWTEDIVGLFDRPSVRSSPAAVTEAWFSPGEEPLRCIQRQIRMSRRAIDVCVFTITDDRIVELLEEAPRRGVRVRIVSDDDKSRDLGSDLERLGRSGAAVRLDRTSDHMHHKFAVFDGARLLTGSYNWTRSAARGNSENVLVTEEPALVEAYAGAFQRVWGRAGPI